MKLYDLGVFNSVGLSFGKSLKQLCCLRMANNSFIFVSGTLPHETQTANCSEILGSFWSPVFSITTEQFLVFSGNCKSNV